MPKVLIFTSISNYKTNIVKKRIITDTNIWYSITKKEILEIIQNYEIVIPIIVLSELYTSPNIYISQVTHNELKKAVNTILENINSIHFIEFDPFEFLLKNISPNISPRLSSQWYLDEFKYLLQLDYNLVKEKHPKRAGISDLTQFVNEKSIGYKKIVDKDKNRFKNLDTRKYTESYILKLANDNLETINNTFPKIQALDFSKNELLINTFDDLLREVSKSGKKIKDNDWIDIFNLTYVSQDDLYWTKEKSKIKHIENVKLEHYLYQKN